MENLNGLLAFVRTAESGSFVAAGRLLGLSASAVGKSVSRLEERLGVRLLQRSTRHLHLTAEGETFLISGQRILADLAEAEHAITRTREAPQGKLRVSLPLIGYRMLMPILSEFMRQYPEVSLDLDFNDRLVDVIEEGLDVVIRSGQLRDSRLKARTIAPFGFCIVGSPEYFERRGVPRLPADLALHACLHYKFPTTGKLQPWALSPDAGHIPPTLVCNSIEALIQSACLGLGLAYLPDFLVRDLLAQGSLTSVLSDCLPQRGTFWAVWPSSRHDSPKIRTFVDYVCRRMLKPDGVSTSI
ncbi:LysR family transcriptional regulator [Paludibacterium purpuratum]|uniref:LysR family transcriptional regulator n=1 Tax=Paludibacterium purpuratum TaxID=1144873 RepID=A0A4R7B3C5_9NEIS|nr:LysR family transcriptional regulator [Paludibacterium purpuratum]TDR76475.1 LysR family transcriptional regulator [Paludibacterium purpuratum]